VKPPHEKRVISRIVGLGMESKPLQKYLPTLAKINDYYSNMTRAQKKIGEYILKNPSSVIKSSITELSTLTGVKSEASIVRFYRLLGFKGYKEFKIQIAQELAGRTFYHSYEDINTDDSPSEIKKKIFSGAISTLISNEQYSNVQSYIDSRNLILQAERIIFLGYAASAAMCYYAYFRFLELGYNCHFFADSHINAAVLAKPRPKDLIFCISHSGETQDLIVPIEKIAHKDVSVILITSSENSTLAKLANVVLVTKGEETNIATDAMSSRVAQLCIIDSLFSIVSLAGGEDALSRLLITRRTFLDYKKQ
jgi:RpiR family carbohydrate utilization transcriptional regulator